MFLPPQNPCLFILPFSPVHIIVNNNSLTYYCSLSRTASDPLYSSTIASWWDHVYLILHQFTRAQSFPLDQLYLFLFFIYKHGHKCRILSELEALLKDYDFVFVVIKDHNQEINKKLDGLDILLASLCKMEALLLGNSKSKQTTIKILCFNLNLQTATSISSCSSLPLPFLISPPVNSRQR